MNNYNYCEICLNVYTDLESTALVMILMNTLFWQFLNIKKIKYEGIFLVINTFIVFLKVWVVNVIYYAICLEIVSENLFLFLFNFQHTSSI